MALLWHYTVLTPKAGPMDVRAFLPLFFFLVSPYKSMNFFLISILAIIFFAVLSYFGYTPTVLFRRARRLLTGPQGRNRLIMSPTVWYRRARSGFLQPEHYRLISAKRRY